MAWCNLLFLLFVKILPAEFNLAPVAGEQKINNIEKDVADFLRRYLRFAAHHNEGTFRAKGHWA
jgi:hypothetical protein